MKEELLTGTAKDHFLSWLDLQDLAPYRVMFDSIPEFIQLAYIVQWLDTVKLRICIEPILGGEFRVFALYKSEHTWIDDRYSDRTSATKNIIQKANEIYNQ